MNQILFDFYTGNGLNTQHCSFDELISVSDNLFENSHNFVQWLFPLDEPSMHNRTAPILDQETIEKLLASPVFCDRLEMAGHKLISFLNRRRDQQGKPIWVTPNNHNYLRISRAIKCFRLFGLDDWAEMFFDFACACHDDYPQDVGLTAVEYWQAAIDGTDPEDG